MSNAHRSQNQYGMTNYIEVQITTTTQAEAERLSDVLLENRLAACVQISGPIQSNYTWEGKRESTPEFLCCVKTDQSLFQSLVETVRANHSYECPQIVAIPILTANDDYLDWMKSSLGQ